MWKAEKPIHIVLHLALIASAIFLITLLFFKVYLPFVTNHNQKIIVPALAGKSLQEVEEILDEADLRYELNDSTFVEGEKSNLVISQHPEGGSEVKKNRKIYITITASEPPKVKMPKLVDVSSLKGAEVTLKSLDLRIGSVEYINSPYKDLVLSQKLKSQEIAPGTYIPKGSKIDLVVGNGEENPQIELPDLVGLPKEEAIKTLEDAGLKIGIIAFDDTTEELNGTVTKQSPSPADGENKTISKGATVDLWVAGQ